MAKIKITGEPEPASPRLLREVRIIDFVSYGDYLVGQWQPDGSVAYAKSTIPGYGHAVAYADGGPGGMIPIDAEAGLPADPERYIENRRKPVTKESSEVDRAREALRRNLISIKKQADILLAELESGS